MNLQIELWSKKTHAFEGVALDLFNESVACYKIGAYRSAFLMSYLALMQTIRQRVLNFNSKPEHVEEKKWKSFREALDSNRNWEEAVMNIIMMSKPKLNQATKTYEPDKRIIRFSEHDEITDEFKKWRHTRNQSAHAKAGSINSATVECFWNFIQDNLFKFHVNGGLEYYKEAIFKSYRDQYERVTVTFKEHLDALPTAELSKEELISLWSYLETNIERLQIINNDDLVEFWSEILFHRNSSVQNSFIEFVKSNSYIFIKFYSLIPNVLSMIFQQTNAHLFKKDILYSWIESSFNHIEYVSYWKLITEIIEKYTPTEDLINFYSRIKIFNIRVLPNDNETSILKKNAFFDSKEVTLCDSLVYDYNNIPEQLRNIEKTCYLLEHITLSPRIISSLSSYVDKLAIHHYPMVNQLYRYLTEFIECNSVFANNVKTVASEKQVLLSQSLQRIIATTSHDGSSTI